VRKIMAAIFAVLIGVTFVGSVFADETIKEETKSSTKADGTKIKKKTKTKKKKKKSGDVTVEKKETTVEKKQSSR
jgi:hypothetical protein